MALTEKELTYIKSLKRQVKSYKAHLYSAIFFLALAFIRPLFKQYILIDISIGCVIGAFFITILDNKRNV